MQDIASVDESVHKFVSTIKAYASMRAYKHLSDYSKKYAQKLQRDLNDVERKLSRMEKAGVRNQKFAMLEMESHVLKFQKTKAESLEIEFMKEAIRISESETMSSEELINLVKHFSEIKL